jgi:hypothetical protein
MSNGHATLELSSLPARHPAIGDALLQLYAPAVIVRLGIDPTSLQAGTMNREVEIDWLRRPAAGSAEQVLCTLGWGDIWQGLARVCEQLPFTKNAHDLTEEAVVGIAALLIHDLEGGVLQTVLPIGSGGDYLLRISQPSAPIQLEVSGLREDAAGTASRSRLNEKAGQVLTHARVGFVSVTTFSHGSGGVVHSYLHFVKKSSGRPKGGKKPSRKGRKK